ncbi:PAS domain-containing protein [Roseicyclus persicicus]|uniref:PAS domain-containing protein n=1 Tax=Roseicyclus persicicus TaxID=2650661 RepID=A0A7X6H0Y2_9RHOB|nr:PAS domain-containing protein [Roseibacterium persicicum]NKX46011.1 PAS domain-containing protein [Roseibacterium persicicum]
MDRARIDEAGGAALPPGLAAVLGHWRGLCRGRAVPARADLDPEALAPWLPDLGIVARDAGGRLRFRLGGRRLARLLGGEARGMPLRVLVAPEDRARLEALANAALDTPRVVTLRLATPAGRGALALMPLADGQGMVTRLLLCLDGLPATGDTARHPAAPPKAAPALRVIAGGRA